MDDEPRSVLMRYSAALAPTTPVQPLGNAGGLSGSRLWRYQAGARCLLLRAWPEEASDPKRLGRIHGWLLATRPLPCIARPLTALDGRTYVEHGGRLWQLEPWMPGVPSLDGMTSGQIRTAFRGLAVLHEAWARFGTLGTSPSVLERLGEIQALIRGGFGETRRVIERHSGDPLQDHASRWLELSQAVASRIECELRQVATLAVRLQPCLRDARPEHMLFTGEQLTGLVDYGAVGIESVAADVSRLLAEWFGTDVRSRALGLEAYSLVRPLDDAELSLIAPLERSAALLGPGRWIRWHFVEGRRFEDPNAARQRLERGLRRLASLAGA